MRWESLFADLEAQWEAEIVAGLEGEIAEAERLERSGRLFVERVRAHRSYELALHLVGGARLRVVVGVVGKDWLSGTEGATSVLIPLSALASAELPDRGAEGSSQVRGRLGIGSPLRALLRDRAMIAVYAANGDVLAEGLLVAVGRDHLDVGLSPPGEVPRRGHLRGVRTVPFAAVSVIRSEPSSGL